MSDILKMFWLKFSYLVIKANELIALDNHSAVIIFTNVGMKNTKILITNVKIAEIAVLSVKDEINIPIAIKAPPKRSMPISEYR